MHVMRDVPEHGPTILETRRNAGQGRKTNVGQVGNLRGGWLPPPVHREGGRGRLPIGRRLPTCPTKSRPPTDARSVFHEVSRAERPSQQTTQTDRLSHPALVCGVPMKRPGHLKVYLGYAAGVGKTYRMLEE